MHATIIQAIILGVILHTQMLSHLQEQQRAAETMDLLQLK